MKTFTKFILSIIYLVIFSSVAYMGGKVITNNLLVIILLYIGSYRVSYVVGSFIDWNFKDISIPQPNNF